MAILAHRKKNTIKKFIFKNLKDFFKAFSIFNHFR